MKTSPQEKAKTQDWHRADIKAALEKSGWNLSTLSKARGYVRGVLVYALNAPYPKAERIIASAIGVAPQTIWPSRYNEFGEPARGRRVRDCELRNTKFNTRIAQCNVDIAEAN